MEVSTRGEHGHAATGSHANQRSSTCTYDESPSQHTHLVGLFAIPTPREDIVPFLGRHVDLVDDRIVRRGLGQLAHIARAALKLSREHRACTTRQLGVVSGKPPVASGRRQGGR